MKKFLQSKQMLQKIYSFFISQSPTHNSVTFKLRFLYELRHKVHHFSESWYGIFHCWFRLVSTIVYTFFKKKYGFFDFSGVSTKNCEYVKKTKFVIKIFFQIMLNEVLKSWKKWYTSADVKANVKQQETK